MSLKVAEKVEPDPVSLKLTPVIGVAWLIPVVALAGAVIARLALVTLTAIEAWVAELPKLSV
ncbi:MAG: hypothetical protein ACRED9_13355, partial [Caulobacteraceae bacterium]